MAAYLTGNVATPCIRSVVVDQEKQASNTAAGVASSTDNFATPCMLSVVMDQVEQRLR